MTDNVKELQVIVNRTIDAIAKISAEAAELRQKYDKLLQFVKRLSRGLENGLTDFEEKIILIAQKILKEIGES